MFTGIYIESLFRDTTARPYPPEMLAHNHTDTFPEYNSSTGYVPMPGVSSYISRVSHSVRTGIPAVWMRAGTSKGLFIHEHNLPTNKDLWAPILLSALGSSDADSRQLNGIGGATSTTSKVAVVRKSKLPGVDVDYTFVQVAPDQPQVDMTGNCGNIASGVGPFALDEGLVGMTEPGQKSIDIKVFNTNTQQCLVETIQITPDGKFSEDGEYSIPGVRGTASPIRMSFLSPCGSVTGRLLPSGAKQELLTVSSARSRTPFMVRASLVDAANPFIFIDAATMPPLYHHAGVGSSISLEIIEEIRVAGAVRLGLAKDIAAASRTRGTPKIALLYPTTRPEATGISHNHADIEVRAFSLGKPHPSFQLTGAVCLGVALSTPGTVAWELWKQGGPGSSNFYPSLPQKTEPDTLKWLIKHPSGVMDAEVKLSLGDDGDRVVERVSVFRTARRLFEGRVFYRL